MRSVTYLLALAAVVMNCIPLPLLAQFEDARVGKEAKLEKELNKKREQCRKGIGSSCYEIVELIRLGQLSVTSADLWALVGEACIKGHAGACVEQRVRQRADSVAQIEALVQAAQRPKDSNGSGRVSANTQRGSQGVAEPTPAVVNQKQQGAWAGILKMGLIVGAGVAVAANTPAGTSSDQSSANGLSAMAVASALLGEREFTEVLRAAGGAGSGQFSERPLTPLSGVTYSGTGFTGSWSYSGKYSPHVRHLLTKVPNWSCPSGPNDGGTTPRLAVRPSSQRDQYVAAAVHGAFVLECAARQGQSEMGAREVEPAMADLFRQAEALCSSSTSVIGRQPPSTLPIWGCPAPYR